MVWWARCRALSIEAGVASSTSAASGREAEHVAEDQHCALAWRQVLERCDERELDALALFVAGRGRSEAALEPQRFVGGRLDPDRLDERLAARFSGSAGGP